MAVIRPFRAFRYDPDKIGARQNIALPLVDAVSAELLRDYYRVYESAIHLAWPRSTAHAVDRLAQWRKYGVLRHDPLPAVYPYYQRFTIYGAQESYTRKGFMCLVRLNPTGEPPDILVHEDVMPHALTPRVALMQQTQMHIAPVHGLYHDPDYTLEPLMDAYMRAPLEEVTDFQGVHNSLGVIQNCRELQQFVTTLRNKKIILADGHHRLASAIQVRDEMQRAHGKLAVQSASNYILMYLSNAASPANRILPTHRLVRLSKGFDNNIFLKKLENYFTVIPVADRTPLYEHIEGQRYSLGLLFRDAQYVLKLKKSIVPETDIALPLPASVLRLPYTVLHYYILQQALGIPYGAQPGSADFSYWKDYSKVLQGVMKIGTPAADKNAYMGVIVNEATLDDLMAVTADSAIMPPKSTYFYPKLLSGLLYASLNEADFAMPFDTYFDPSFDASLATTATAGQ